MSYRGSVDSRKQPENFDQGMRPRTFLDRHARRGGHARTDSNGNRGVNREFRVVRDNRVNQNANREPKPALPQGSTSAKEKVSGVTEKGYAFSGSFTNFSCHCFSVCFHLLTLTVVLGGPIMPECKMLVW